MWFFLDRWCSIVLFWISNLFVSRSSYAVQLSRSLINRIHIGKWFHCDKALLSPPPMLLPRRVFPVYETSGELASGRWLVSAADCPSRETIGPLLPTVTHAQHSQRTIHGTNHSVRWRPTHILQPRTILVVCFNLKGLHILSKFEVDL